MGWTCDYWWLCMWSPWNAYAKKLWKKLLLWTKCYIWVLWNQVFPSTLSTCISTPTSPSLWIPYAWCCMFVILYIISLVACVRALSRCWNQVSVYRGPKTQVLRAKYWGPETQVLKAKCSNTCVYCTSLCKNTATTTEEENCEEQ